MPEPVNFVKYFIFSRLRIGFVIWGGDLHEATLRSS